MFNISEKTEIIGIEKTGCTREHLQHCINKKSEPPKYKRFGKFSSSGTMVVHTKNGDFTIEFAEKRGWAKMVKVL